MRPEVKINFDMLRWESATPGMRFKVYRDKNKQVRLLELTKEFVENDWCLKGHIGYILDGRLEITFSTELPTLLEMGDGLMITEGIQHKARALSEVVKLILVEDY